jgi:hypothetical protein
MAPPLRRSTAGTTGASPATSGAFTSPAGGVADDVVLLRLSLVPNGATVAPTPTAPDGTWTEDPGSLASQTNPSPNHVIRTFVKRLTGPIAASYTFTWTSQTSYWQGVMVCYSGCAKTGSPVNTSGASVSPSTQVSADAPSITTTVDDCELVFFGSTYNLAWGGTVPTGMTDGVTSTNLYTADQDWPTQGATGTRSSTNAASSADWTTGALVALAPDAGAAAPFKFRRPSLKHLALLRR